MPASAKAAVLGIFLPGITILRYTALRFLDAFCTPDSKILRFPVIFNSCKAAI